MPSTAARIKQVPNPLWPQKDQITVMRGTLPRPAAVWQNFVLWEGKLSVSTSLVS